MKPATGFWIAVATLFVLHNDLWLWNEPRLVFGLPAGLAWHVGFCLVTAGVMAVYARRFGDDPDRR